MIIEDKSRHLFSKPINCFGPLYIRQAAKGKLTCINKHDVGNNITKLKTTDGIIEAAK